MKIYTRHGDTGKTSLFGGQQVDKDMCRIKAYGTIDELNSCLGMALSHQLTDRGTDILLNIQHQLFILGADLATPPDSKTQIQRIEQHQIDQIEADIDELDSQLPNLKNFILPGGSQPGAHLHLARTICRRAERASVSCKKKGENISDEAIVYLNRLSDLLFVLARYENKALDIKEYTWQTDRNV